MTIAKTHTGGFTIGFRRMGSEWQKDTGALIDWAIANGFGAIDIANNAVSDLKKIKAAGLEVGSVDLLGWGGY